MPIPLSLRVLEGIETSISFTSNIIRQEINRRSIYDFVLPQWFFRRPPFLHVWLISDIKNSINNVFKWFI